MKVSINGSQYWYFNGKRHREDGPALIESGGAQYWYHHGKRHREDGPALIESDGSQYWYLNDKLHREDGPAIVFSNGERRWYLNGKRVTQEEVEGPKEKELTVAEVSKLLGFNVKIVKGERRDERQ